MKYDKEISTSEAVPDDGSSREVPHSTVCLGTYAQIHQTIYMFSAEWKTSHSWHSCKKCATLTGGLRVIRSDTEQLP